MPVLTEKNHYNPCFWTAHWSAEYSKAVSKNLQPGRARDAVIFSLNVKANKVIRTTCKDVHYDKHLGAAEVTREAADDFCRRRHPAIYAQFKRRSDSAIYPVVIDFEDFFRGLEKLPPYKAVMKIISTNTISGSEQKVQVAHFILWQSLRCHAIMQSMIEHQISSKFEKFEYLLDLK